MCALSAACSALDCILIRHAAFIKHTHTIYASGTLKAAPRWKKWHEKAQFALFCSALLAAKHIKVCNFKFNSM